MINFDEFDIEETSDRDCIFSDEKFCEFLYKHNVYNDFVKNLRNESKKTYHLRYWSSIDTFCEDMKKRAGVQSYISLAFRYENTPQGRYFWSKIHRLWIRSLTKDRDLLSTIEF